MSSKRILLSIFEAYTGSSSTNMTSSKFLKIMKDSNLLDHNLRQSDVDLIFTKCKLHGQKTIDVDGFKKGLEMVAARKDVSYPELLDYIQMTTADGPSYNGTTVAQEIRFYDDKDTYTGVHKAGGPTVVDRDKQGLENLLDRSDADVRGLKKDMKEAHGRPVLAGRREMTDQTSQSPQATPAPVPPQRSGRTPTTTATTPRDYSNDALIENLENRLKRLSATPPQESTQPISAKSNTRQALSAHISSRVTPPTTPSSSFSTPPQVSPPAPPVNSRSRMDLLPPAPPAAAASERSLPSQAPVRDNEAALFATYKTFCTNDPEGKEMDSARFVKFCRDTKLIGSVGHLTSVDADLIFQKSKKAGNYGKRIGYEDFRMVAIPELAKRIGCTLEEIFAAVIRSEGPTLNNTTTPSDVRFHDDVSTYTGVHAEGHNPSFTPTNSRITLEDLLDRSPADNRGIKLSSEAAAVAAASSSHKSSSKRSSRRSPSSPPSLPPPSHSPRPVIAGEANKAGGIYDRLSQQDSYTGVYRERFNQPTTPQDNFRGHTNTGTDVPIHDISQVLNRR